MTISNAYLTPRPPFPHQFPNRHLDWKEKGPACNAGEVWGDPVAG